MGCKETLLSHQPFPTSGPLVAGMNLELRELMPVLSGSSTSVYCYVIATVKNKEGTFIQSGTAPNFQGGLITLCTCKHWMRAFHEPEKWKDQWVAGFSSVRAGGGRNALVFLMRVGLAFPSHKSLWESPLINASAKSAKAAHRCSSGDLYKPMRKNSRPFSPQDYCPPVGTHDHASDGSWQMDINYCGGGGRRPSLLVGSPEDSFLWTQPALFFQRRIHRGQKKLRICDLGEWLGEGPL